MPSVNVRGGTLSYTEHGKDRPIVLIHGFPLDSRMWDKQIPALADFGRVIAIDLLGFGKSPSNNPFTLMMQARLLHEALKAMNALPCIPTGLSMGGYIALEFARAFPSDMQALMLLDTRAEADSPEGKAGRNKMLEILAAGGAKAVADQLIGKLVSADTIQHRPQVVRDLRSMMEQCSVKTIEHALVALRDREDTRSCLASIAVPTLIIVGQEDVITPIPSAETLHKGIAHSRLEIIKGSGHMTTMEQPEQVNQAIRQFVAGLK
jgi:pimeloyl-ACP methyl ester carboxylesterase